MSKDTFQRIIDREIPATIIYEDDKAIAFLDIDPEEKGHFLVVPKQFSENLFDIDEETFAYIFPLARKLALQQIKKLNASGFRLIVNNGESAGQAVFRTHIHIIPYYDN